MPVVIAKPKPIKPVDLAPQPQAAPGLTREEVARMLAERDAMWQRQLASATQSLKELMAATKPQPRTGSTIVLTKDDRGDITGARILPQP